MTTTITRNEDAIDVRSPAPRIRYQWLVVASWLPFAAAGVVATYITISGIPAMFAEGQWFPAILFAAGSVIVVLGCLAGALSALYGMIGTEHVHIDANGITTDQELGRLRLRQHYPPYRVRNVRAFVPRGEWGSWTPPPPRVLFDTPGRVKSFGAFLTNEQAAEVASAASELLPAAPSTKGQPDS